MTLPDFLTAQADGEIVITGHRITIVDVLYFYREGDSVDMLAARFPTVPLATLHRLIAFYLDNAVDMDAYLTRYMADLDALRRNGRKTPSEEELRRRLRERIPVEPRAAV